MIEGAFISDALIYESFKKNAFNLIVAPCGSGKTTAAFKSIPDYLKIEQKKSLILINTVSAAESFVADGYGYFYNYNGKEWDFNFVPQYDKPTIMTYSAFGAQIKKDNIKLEDYDYIVCDEIHTLNQYIAISRAKLLKQYPQALPWEINDMLQMTCFNYIALESIFNAIEKEESWVFGLTATPTQLYKSDLKKLGAIVNEVRYSQKLRAYEIFCKFEYTEIEPILKAILPNNTKRLLFFNTIKELKHYKNVLIECGRAAEALWTTEPENRDFMNEHQLTTRDYILKEHKLPEDVQDLLINRAYETGITIKDPLVKQAYIHSSNSDVREQVRNRLRQDLEIVGYYNKQLSKQEHKEQKKKEILSQKIEASLNNIPIEYLNRKLYTADKQDLVQIIQFPKKWTSLKRALAQQGYEIVENTDRQGRYSIIRYLSKAL